MMKSQRVDRRSRAALLHDNCPPTASGEQALPAPGCCGRSPACRCSRFCCWGCCSWACASVLLHAAGLCIAANPFCPCSLLSAALLLPPTLPCVALCASPLPAYSSQSHACTWTRASGRPLCLFSWTLCRSQSSPPACSVRQTRAVGCRLRATVQPSQPVPAPSSRSCRPGRVRPSWSAAAER